MKIGFIGIGVMGHAIVSNLLKANYSVNVYSRRKESTDGVVKEGAKYLSSPKLIAENSDIIFTMVGVPTDVKQVYIEENGIIDGVSEGKILIDLTTSTSSLAIELQEAFEKIGVNTLDAPVSGGEQGAINATLTIMVGGQEDTYKKVEPIFEVIGKTVVLQGPSGSGQHTKMCNQIALAGNMLGAIELITYANAVGLDPRRVLKSVGVGSAASNTMTLYAAKIFEDDYKPGFYVKHFVKDLNIALNECKKHNITLPGLETAINLYEKLVELGYENDGIQSLIKVYNYDK